MALPPNLEFISQAAKLLENGDVVAVPTETVYGLAARIDRADAIKKIFSVKGRPFEDPLIVHVGKHLCSTELLEAAGIIDAKKLTVLQIEILNTLMRRFWPGPLTLVMPKGEDISRGITANKETVAVRMPAHPMFQELLSATGVSLAAPSANRFGHVSPTTADHVRKDLGERVSCILDGGPAKIGVESTIAFINAGGELTILRQGGIPEDVLLHAHPKITSAQKPLNEEIIAPGMLASHYSPDKSLWLFTYPESDIGSILDRVHKTLKEKNVLDFGSVGWLVSDIKLRPKLGITQVLSIAPSDKDVAEKLYAAMRTLEENPAVNLIVALVPQRSDGIWPAIADRLTRAARPNF